MHMHLRPCSLREGFTKLFSPSADCILYRSIRAEHIKYVRRMGYPPILILPLLYLAQSCYITTLCFNRTLSCVDSMVVIMGDIDQRMGKIYGATGNTICPRYQIPKSRINA